MKNFFKNIILLLLIAVVVGEVVVRLTHAVADIPQRTIDEHGIQKYFPNQEGYWKGGAHKWTVNNSGWVGELPKSYDSLIIIIGDSFIENFMNPNECHQSVLLKKKMTNYNFMEAARSGVSFIEAMEMSKQLDTLNPIQTLIYLNDKDFYESAYNIEPHSDITQVDLKTNKINYGELKSPALKKILYKWKLLYYFYNRFPLQQPKPNKMLKEEIDKELKAYELKNREKVFQLINYTKKNYTVTNKTLVFHPNSSKEIINRCKSIGFNVIALDSSNDKTWTFEHDSHWTCYGHERTAQQVSDKLIAILK
ncbi:hypothetical protein [Gelidibacter japonicus]|uniref:hypothetical protein n=1 Tax=Gelidibacter japonicus TaxID=1962232 RepID=UPI003A90655A